MISRKLLALAFAVTLAFSTVGTAVVSSFGTKAHDAEVGIVQMRNGKRAVICSGTSIETPDKQAYILTARHCVVDEDTNVIADGEEITFADNGGGPFYATEVAAISDDEDLALLRVLNPGKLPAVKLGDEHQLTPGDPLFLWSFPRGLGKIYTTGMFVAPAFPAVPKPAWTLPYGWQNAMPLQDTTSYGSSGSGIFDEKQQALIGVTVGFLPPDFNIKIAMPVSRVKFLLGHMKENSAEHWRKTHAPKAPKFDPDDDD